MTKKLSRKTTTPAPIAPVAPPASTCQLWYAVDQYNDFAGILVSEPGDPLKPIAFVFHDQEQPHGTKAVARCIAEEPWRLDDAVNSTGGPCRMDLRDRGRLHSWRPMPGWCYSLRLCENEMREGAKMIEWNPFCMVRLINLVEQRQELKDAAEAKKAKAGK